MSNLLARWRDRLIGTKPVEQATAAPVSSTTAPLAAPASRRVDMFALLSADFAAQLPIAKQATAVVMDAIRGVDLEPLARRSPALAGYEWTAYLHCSIARIVRVLRALQQQSAGARVLDFGSYFGNFSLACRSAGYAVDAVDSYDEYGAAFASVVAAQRAAGVSIQDFSRTGIDLAATPDATYDAVLCMGVIEHIPHTPRLLLDTLTRVLKPGGSLILDTPNLAYLYKRLALLDGGTIFCPIAQQYYTELPFEGHHREYIVDEIAWMLNEAGHEPISLETFNYSFLAHAEIAGPHVGYHDAMDADPSLREVIFSVSRRR